MRLPSLKIFIFFLICWFQLGLAQYSIPTKPNVLYPVYDEVGLLSQEEKDLLNTKLIRFADSTSTEIEVIIIPTTKGEDVNFVATLFGEKWGIGTKEFDNGIVFLIATEDRKFSIQQGRNVEQYLTASVAGQILDYVVTPHFQQGNWYEGINRGTSSLMEAVQGKFKPQQKPTSTDDVSPIKLMIVIFFIIVILFLIMNNRGGGYHDDDEDVILSRRGRRTYPGGFFPFPGSFGGGGFGGSSGGGGFGGFGGGGSFGGGGASGGW